MSEHPTAAEKPFVRAAAVFVDHSTGRVLVAPCFNHGGMYAEIPDAVVACSFSDLERLGSVVFAALSSSKYEPSFNYRRRKPTDWPAFRASGEKTLRGFTRRWLSILLKGADSSNAVYVAKYYPQGEWNKRLTDLKASIPSDASPDKVGATLVQLVERIRAFLREDGAS